jgi:hypothetical protein
MAVEAIHRTGVGSLPGAGRSSNDTGPVAKLPSGGLRSGHAPLARGSLQTPTHTQTQPLSSSQHQADPGTSRCLHSATMSTSSAVRPIGPGRVPDRPDRPDTTAAEAAPRDQWAGCRRRRASRTVSREAVGSPIDRRSATPEQRISGGPRVLGRAAAVSASSAPRAWRSTGHTLGRRRPAGPGRAERGEVVVVP